jgi:asparagine synthase (glutamine-hydrolysing)
MCGIAGYLTPKGHSPDVLERMVETLRHRGPDEAGFFRSGPFHCGMRRLAINDPAGGGQPLRSEDGSTTVLYNGEIYNHRALRAELTARGHRFVTDVDGEVIAHLYQEIGEAAFERLDGMYAAALWDERRGRLILARDIPGEKPLHYAPLPDGGVAFASEVKALARHPDVDLTLDRQALWDYPTFLWTPEPSTAFVGVRALPRGHLLIADDDGLRLVRHRNRFNLGLAPFDDPAEAVAETRRVVTEAVESRLMADVAVGSFLSGGLDSSIVAALACRALGPIDTFSIGFEDLADPYHGRADETPYAVACAAHIGSRHHAIHVGAADFRAELERFVHHGDQPFAVSSGLGILAIARAARERGLKVLLSGDGADECFGGYSWYAHLADTGAPEDAAPDAPVVSYQSFGAPLEARQAAIARMRPEAQAWAWHYYAHEQEKAELFADDWRDGLESSLRLLRAFKPDQPWSRSDFIAQDRDFYFPQEMLRKVDRMTMAYSVEGRAPFAAPAVLAHADRLAFSHMVRDGELKWALRRAFENILPMDVVNRPKHGFNVPIDHWLKNEWSDLVDEAFAEGSALRRRGVVGPAAAATARRMLADPQRLNGHSILCFVTLNLWLEQVESWR